MESTRKVSNVIKALSTTVNNPMSSLFSRQLGAMLYSFNAIFLLLSGIQLQS